MHSLHVTLFGKAHIPRRGAASSELPIKAQELLFYLLLHRAQPHRREMLACELWADTPAALTKKYLRQCLWQLQQGLELPEPARAPLLHLDREWVSVHSDAALHVDAQQFEQAFALMRDVPGEALDQRQAETARMAAALYHGDLLTGWYQDWCLVERERYQSMFFAMLDKLMDYCQLHGLFDQGIAYGMRLLRLDYTRESTHRRLMRLHGAAGDRTAALRQFDLCARALEKEFGVRPGEPTIALFEQLRTDHPNIGARQRPLADISGAETDMFSQVLAELSHLRAYVSTLQRDIEQIKQALHREML